MITPVTVCPKPFADCHKRRLPIQAFRQRRPGAVHRHRYRRFDLFVRDVDVIGETLQSFEWTCIRTYTKSSLI